MRGAWAGGIGSVRVCNKAPPFVRWQSRFRTSFDPDAAAIGPDAGASARLFHWPTGGRTRGLRLRMRDGQMASTQSAHKGAAKPNLCDHYKPVGIQAISAATVCRGPKPAPKSSWVK